MGARGNRNAVFKEEECVDGGLHSAMDMDLDWIQSFQTTIL